MTIPHYCLGLKGIWAFLQKKALPLQIHNLAKKGSSPVILLTCREKFTDNGIRVDFSILLFMLGSV
jgi:hypothetical protein